MAKRDEQRVAGWIARMVGAVREVQPTKGHREGWDAAQARNEGHGRGCVCARCTYSGVR